MTMTSSSRHTYAVIAKIKEREREQAQCRHAFRPVPDGSGGFRPFLQCKKCGKREDDQ